ncbi:sugar ABC transporter ATP-binding protein [Aquisediminimonas sediminicola]|uniref:sugar ABC transporter ATP-binding protein n=1 Tax=Alteraquisediminimonas sediminicola TaxID=2676787 RepID=UPI001C8E289B|nr:sugar ABC transporter ATP-binding protein [Aquisediminimonas sediminicola]
MMTRQTSPLITLKGVSKSYRGNPALKDVDFDIVEGEVHALLGENGAGKSTLMKIVAGVTEASSGDMELDGVRCSFASPAEALANGIVMVFQETSLVPSMTVSQNLYLGNEKFFNRLRGINISAQQFLQSLNFNVDPALPVSALGAAQKQMVEIARAVLQNARLIIFDEPTATLTPEEKKFFFALVERLKKRGVAIVFISHALEEALAIADRITVLRDGELVVTDHASTFDRARIVRSMVGRTLSEQLYQHNGGVRTPGPRVLSVQNMSMGSIVRNTSFNVYAGQITGIFGLIGSGRTEAAKVVAGVMKRNLFFGGEVRLDGEPVSYRLPRQAMLDGIVYVTEDRKVEGFFETMSISENIYMGDLARTSAKFVNRAAMRELAKNWREQLNIRSINDDAKVIELSGGNQQKVVIAKSLVQKPKLIIFDEPTRGVDVGAIAEIHELIRSLADTGMAVVLISSYLPEILSLSDRILVTRQGRVVEEFSPHEATEEVLMYAAVH